ncbi:MAG: ion transporter [Acetatifactor sp.]|nr:ion transporter [Acetatifactor sp.]
MKSKNISDIKKRIYEILQIGYGSDFVSKAFDLLIVAVIIINIAITFILTFDQALPYKDMLEKVEFVTILIFLAEYVLRVWTAEYLFPGKKVGASRLQFIFSFYGLVDILTILPYFLPFFFPSGVVAFRMFRVVRIFRLFRVNSSYDAFNVITEVLKERKNQLLSSMFLIVMLMIASSLCMYSLEHEAQPEYFSNAFSGIWWSMSTVLTVGYGDIYPITVGGKLMAILIAFLGVGVVAIPTGIISAGFVEYYSGLKKGVHAQHDASFASIKIGVGHSYAGKMVKELQIPDGMYPAALMRGEDIIIPDPNQKVQAGDRLMLGTLGDAEVECLLEEVVLGSGHPWIGKRIRNLDISRRDYVVMIRREQRNIRPQDDMTLKANDIVLLLQRTDNE